MSEWKSVCEYYTSLLLLWRKKGRRKCSVHLLHLTIAHRPFSEPLPLRRMMFGFIHGFVHCCMLFPIVCPILICTMYFIVMAFTFYSRIYNIFKRLTANSPFIQCENRFSDEYYCMLLLLDAKHSSTFNKMDLYKVCENFISDHHSLSLSHSLTSSISVHLALFRCCSSHSFGQYSAVNTFILGSTHLRAYIFTKKLFRCNKL